MATVASPLGGEAGFAVLAPIGGFAAAGTLWLMLVYWKGLGIGVGSGPSSRRLPISGVAWVLAIVGVCTAVAAMGPSRTAAALAGLVPTSGGTDTNDPEARAGVGDGDDEVSASEHPESVGYTESEIYLETDKPSLYDAFNETYGEPFKREKFERMIALGQLDFNQQDERPSENLKGGREFSAVRRKPDPQARRPGDRAAAALVTIKGPTPLHLALASYSHFNGAVWREDPCYNQHLLAEAEPSSKWLRVWLPPVSFLVGSVVHQVRIGTLESSPMPIPSHAFRFRVGSVNRLDFFGWAQFGILRMIDRTVPAGTVIDSEAWTVAPESLRSLPFNPVKGNDTDHQLTFLGEYAIDPAVAALARSWTAGIPEGWCQVEAVIAALRSRYAHDRSATVPAGCNDVVAEFLLRRDRGPDYLFASSAVVLLRALGYPSRAVSGLYAAPERYDPPTRQTPVTRDDVHFWAEVRLPDGRWVAVEPTPGYELMPPVRPWTEAIARAFAAAWSWTRRHAVGVLAIAVAIAVLAARRRELIDRLATVTLGLIPPRDPRRFVMRTLRLVELRSKWAGRARPAGRTLSRWYLPIAGREMGGTRDALEGLVRLADWVAHAPAGAGPPAPEGEMLRTCRSAARDWTLARFRRANATTADKVVTT